MKIINQAKCFVALVAMSSTLTALAADKTVAGKTTETASPYLGELSSVTSMELPAKAATLVSQAKAKARSQATVDVVKTAVGLNPAAAGPVVGSIAQAVPEMAPVAASTAVSLVPDQASAIARVAAAAAPAKAGEIVAAVCRVLPKHYKEVASAVAEVAPSMGKDILTAVATTIPALKAPLAKAIASYNANNAPAVATVLEQVQPTLDLASTSPAQTASDLPIVEPPSFGPPPVVTTSPHQNLDPGSGTLVTGRNYSAP